MSEENMTKAEVLSSLVRECEILKGGLIDSSVRLVEMRILAYIEVSNNSGTIKCNIKEWRKE